MAKQEEIKPHSGLKKCRKENFHILTWNSEAIFKNTILFNEQNSIPIPKGIFLGPLICSASGICRAQQSKSSLLTAHPLESGLGHTKEPADTTYFQLAQGTRWIS